MKLVFYNEYIMGNELFFWIIVSLIVMMIGIAIIFVRKEIDK
jgi:dolichyl-phosphate-mannose--protein O-mannosyl transferase